MALPEEPILSAYLHVLYHAIIHSRSLALDTSPNKKQIADVMDAIHNIPELLNNWEECDQSFLFDTLKRYDKKWAKTDNFSLVRIFEEYIQSKDQTRIINERRKEFNNREKE